MATMRAVQADAIRRPMVLRNIAVPEIGEQDALVRVVASGICRTDWHVWNGDWTWAGLDLPLPITLGHEIGGVVERVGSQVTNLKPGMRVCVPFNFADGTCPYCKRGKQNLCENAAWNFTTRETGRVDLGLAKIHTEVSRDDAAATIVDYSAGPRSTAPFWK